MVSPTKSLFRNSLTGNPLENLLGVSVRGGGRRALYGASQLARIAWYTRHYMAGRRRMGPLTQPGEAPYADEFKPLDRGRLTASFRELFEKDWNNIAEGVYKLPPETKRLPSLSALLAASRDYMRDADRVAQRKHRRNNAEVFRDDTKGKYPRYYLQNFHYQTDGWLSEESAARYNMQVETLFTGAAGAMRRQVLPYIRSAIGQRDQSDVALLDLGCGTGVFLETVLDNWPRLNVTALDLSPSYLGRTRNALGRYRSVSYVEALAEKTGLPSGSLDVITAVYLFHELPPKIRREVMAEAARLLRPRGRFIVADTLQYGDEPGLDILLENFPRGFHEPYYDSYCRTDLSAMARAYGFERQDEAHSFLTKVSVFTLC